MDKFGNIAAGGLIRDHCVILPLGFQRNIGACSSMAAALWSLRDGLNLAKDFDYRCVDSGSIVNIIQDKKCADIIGPKWKVTQRCRSTMIFERPTNALTFWPRQVWIIHLALFSFTIAPFYLSFLFQEDFVDAKYPKLIIS
ncbi:hypothetical protein RHGRI_000084 [Rhododendron griersonianum]|uniref:RNase H type-1 domain-containing protein n=1 Tax=Rhododendron griersonianum TaxID=479676 RepID=A0AAV6LHI7_9ERIC|nr:hypothetical protein RHGRI_000084 [Rhododendron griersonianum]